MGGYLPSVCVDLGSSSSYGGKMATCRSGRMQAACAGAASQTDLHRKVNLTDH